MAKKPLGEPKAPRGPQYRFFDLLQRTVRLHGDPSLDTIRGMGLYCSRQVLHRALIGPMLPSRKLLEELLRVLQCSDEARRRILAAYEEAQEDRIQRMRHSALPTSVLIDHRANSSTANEFRDRLLELYRWSGQPSLRWIERQTRLPPSTVHGWLQGDHIPANYDALISLLQFLRDRPLRGNEHQEWEKLWDAARIKALAKRGTKRFS